MVMSVTAPAAVDVDAGGVGVLDMASGGGGAEGHASKVRTGGFARTGVTRDQRTLDHLLQGGHGEEIL